jgi:hypothetical protein
MAIFVSYFSCSSEESARRLVNAVLVAGLQPQLRAPRLPGQPWQVLAPADLEPTAENLADLEQAMAEAASRSGGHFDGCEPA